MRARPVWVSVAVMVRVYAPNGVAGSRRLSGRPGDGLRRVEDGADDLGGGAPAQPLDRAGDGDRAEYAARAVAHRGGERRDPGLPLGDAVRPPPAADVEEGPGGEARRVQQ